MSRTVTGCVVPQVYTGAGVCLCLPSILAQKRRQAHQIMHKDTVRTRWSPNTTAAKATPLQHHNHDRRPPYSPPPPPPKHHAPRLACPTRPSLPPTHLLVHKALGAHKLVAEEGAAVAEGKAAHHAIAIKGVARVGLVDHLQREGGV